MKIILLLLISVISYAQPTPILKYQCNVQKDRIIFDYELTENDVQTNEKANVWRLRDLRTIAKSQSNENWTAWVEKTRIIEKTCTTKYGSYDIEIGEKSGNPENLYGLCGGWLTGWVKIKKNGKLLKKEIFENNCNSNGLITHFEFDTKRNSIVSKKFVEFEDYFQNHE